MTGWVGADSIAGMVAVQAGRSELALFQAKDFLSGGATSDAALRQVLQGLPGVDQVGAQARVAGLATRSIKKDAKMAAIELAVAMVDLTTLEGADTPGKVRGLCAKAMQPDPADPAVPPVAAVCVYPDLVGVAKAELAGGGGAGASVATPFPSRRASLALKLADVADAAAAGRHANT